MHIIITDAWMAKQRAMHINGWRVMALGFVLALVMVLSAVAVYNWVLLEGMRRGWPVFQSWSKVVSPQSTAGNDVYMRENLDALARKLGEMQARMLQIDALGDRVAGLAGINPKNLKNPWAQGAPWSRGRP